jgi:V8-like Glu-specific endopeptidase
MTHNPGGYGYGATSSYPPNAPGLPGQVQLGSGGAFDNYGDAAPAIYGRAQARGLDALEPPAVDWSRPGAALSQLAGWLVNRLRYEAIPVQDTGVYPFNAICKIETAGGDGSGFLIGPDTVLTAAHMVHGETSATLYPALNNNKSAVAGIAVSSADWTIDPRFVSSGESDDADLAVIRITNGQRAPSHFRIEEQRHSPAGGIAVAGYGHGEDVQRIDTDTIRDVHAETFTYSSETRHGTSGSPVFYLDSGSAIATGVHVSGVDAHNRKGSGRVNIGCRLTDAKILWLRAQAGPSGI